MNNLCSTDTCNSIRRSGRGTRYCEACHDMALKRRMERSARRNVEWRRSEQRESNLQAALAKLAKRSRVTDGGCLEWTGARNLGYGVVWDGKRTTTVHRIAWRAANGEVPNGFELDHLCRNRACWNISHLEVVSHAENVRRGMSRWPVARGEANGNHKLTMHQVQDIRREFRDGATKSGLSREYGVSRGNIRFILSGVTWVTA